MAIEKHNHDGMDSNKIKVYNVIPTYEMTSTQLNKYLARPAIQGEEFNVYISDTLESAKYIHINNTWTKIGLATTICGKIYNNTTQAYTTTQDKLLLNTSSFASGLTVDTTNNRITVSTAGYYFIYGQVAWDTPTADKSYSILIYKNNSAISQIRTHTSTNNSVSENISNLLYLDVDDYIELFAYQNSGSTIYTKSGDDDTFLTIYKI